MKNFIVYAKVNLVKKPDWLDDFRKKYDKPFEYHITLKQSCFVSEDKVSDIKNKLSLLFPNFNTTENSISLVFNSLNIPRIVGEDICIMIDCENNADLMKLQQSILLCLKDYQEYRKAKYKAYAENFRPHITIGRELTEEKWREASKELEGKKYACEGIVEKIVLVVTNEATVTEANKPENQTIYKL